MWPPLPQLLTEELSILSSAWVVHCYNGKVWLRKGCQWTTNYEMSWSQIGRFIRITGYYHKQIFKHASICIIKVLNLSKVSKASPTVLFQRYFKGSTPAFHSPSQWYELGGIKCHWNCVLATLLRTCLKNSLAWRMFSTPYLLLQS